MEAVVRTVPHQREVVRGTWQGQHRAPQKVYAKKFTGARAAQHFARDLSGVSDLIAANIPTPPLLYQGMAQDGAYLLVFAEIVDAPNAEQVWKNLNTNTYFDLTEKLVKIVAQHHNAGLLQADLHLKNFLIADHIIYTLDGDGIRPLSRLFRKYQTQRNLATLFSKMDVLGDDWMDKLYETYCQHVGIAYSPFDEAEIWSLTQKIRRQTASDYADKKVFRQCTDVTVLRQNSLFNAISSDFLHNDFLQSFEQINTYFTKDNLLKNGSTCTVALAQINNQKIVIKRYNIKNFWHGMSRSLRQSRAAVSWANAHRLKLLNIATAKPVALIEHRKYCLKGKTYFLAEYIDAQDVAQYFAQTQNKTQRAEAIKNIATLFLKLHLLQISHGDMKATNIKMQDMQPVLIDLDSMHQHQWDYFAQKSHVRDLKRFMQNWQNDNALYNAFVKAFNVVYEDHALLIRAGIATNNRVND